MPQHQVVDMMAADHDPAKGTDVVNDGVDQEAYAKEGDEEADGSEEEAAAGPVGDAFVEDPAGAGEVEQDQHEAGAEDGKREKNQGSGPVHRAPFSPQSMSRGTPL